MVGSRATTPNTDTAQRKYKHTQHDRGVYGAHRNCVLVAVKTNHRSWSSTHFNGCGVCVHETVVHRGVGAAFDNRRNDNKTRSNDYRDDSGSNTTEIGATAETKHADSRAGEQRSVVRNE